MSIASDALRKAGPFAGDGTTVTFPFTFKIFSTSDVLVVLTSAAGVEAELSSGYTVAMNADQDDSPGGTVTMATAPATGELLTLGSQVAATQLVELTNSGGFYPAVINTSLDKLTALIQQLKEEMSRAVKTGISDAESPDTLLARIDAAVASAAALDVTAVSPFMATLLDDADAAIARATLGARAEADDVRLAAGKVIVLEGATDDAFETTLTVVDPTADRTVALPNASGTLALETPAGAVMYFAMSSAPTGWLKANGAAVSRTTYAALFTAIGTTFGAGDGSTTFNVPDLRGEFIRVWDDGRGVDSGRAFGSAQSGSIESHNHVVKTAASSSSGSSSRSIDGAGGLTNSTENTGGTETRPRNVALLACIKY